ncbi:claudin-4 [Trichomycterus rosablanca]|uniref:claudin-4 n=1 Tax=Trichomycterus rosablanca TaxID=2290929 RepID=UPI002F350ACF
MATTGLQVLGFLVSIAGWLCGVLVCAAPFWRVSAFVGDELVVSEVRWEGLWMTCLSQPGRVQCKAYDSALALSGSIQFCRMMVVLSLLMGLLALPLGVVGLKCTHCLDGERGPKARLVRVAGAVFMAAGVAFFVPVFWTTVAVIRDFYDPNVAPPLKRELGPALYLGGGVALMMLLGGVMLHQGGAAPGGFPAKPGAIGAPTSAKNNPQAAAEGKQEKAYV